MTTHVAFVKAPYLAEILAGRKRVEVRCAFGRLACESVREGDVFLLKKSGGEIEAMCDVGEVTMHRGARPEQVAEIAREYAASESSASDGYFAKYVPPQNRSRSVNICLIELRNVRSASLTDEVTPRNVRSGWVTLDYFLSRRI
jgi:ASC-1-like (ASCH) protein